MEELPPKHAEIIHVDKEIMLNESAVITDTETLYPVCSEDDNDSVVDYKTLYEEEVSKNVQLQKEIQRLTLMLENRNGRSGLLL